ncbi:LytR family transcriptional regulator [Streptomyces nitrosporeus]|uniref:LytR family transcriptional regulator n=1 Tax=Streptomyces nitrosporeus TaxID=28894 RepID=A0A5J6FI22_9ACTN|nr:LCP family protein [Streptomyces nitrosporeus]QEU74540.1 LytR family transcriptional regulator [Streptomyces nitrosporeus]GGY83918.1 membrane protein [Streptomyces nitrosporeus]
MNDRPNPYDPYYQQQPQIIGYDEYGQPVYQQQEQSRPQPYDPYAQQPQEPRQPQGGQTQHGYGDAQGYGYDPYAGTGQGYDPYAQQQPVPPPAQQGYDYGDGGYGTYGAYGQSTGTQPAADSTGQWAAQAAPSAPTAAPSGPRPDFGQTPEPVVPEQRRADRDHRGEQFSFIEEPDEDSEDVIDWLKFTESRSERREEARRRGRNRLVALIVVAALVVVGGAGYLWFAGKIPGMSGEDGRTATANGPQQRDVIVVHLHNTKKGGTSTALLVDNATTKQGTTVLLPNSLALAADDGTTITLGDSVDGDGSTGTREAVDTLLGTKITGTWRLDTPYLENLVELVGTIEVDTDTDVPDTKKGAAPVVRKGEAQTLSGQMAVAYATYRGPGEPEAKQLTRFGEVLRSTLRKMSEDPEAATVTVQTLAQILDPSLPEQDLGASLAKLAGHAKVGDYTTTVLPVQEDGTLTEKAEETVVKEVLGGTVKAPEQGAAVRVGVTNATGVPGVGPKARVQLVNGGYAFVDSGEKDTVPASEVRYRTEEDKAKAVEVAKTLGLTADAAKKGELPANADVSVVLGQDYKIPK